MLTVFERLKEPSSWAGFATILGGFGLFGLDEGVWQTASVVVAGGFGLLSVIVREKGWGG